MIKDTKTLSLILKRRYVNMDNISRISRDLNITRRTISNICNEFLPYKQEFINAYDQGNVAKIFHSHYRVKKSRKNSITKEHKDVIHTTVKWEYDHNQNLHYTDIYRLLRDKPIFISKPISFSTIYAYLKEKYKDYF